MWFLRKFKHNIYLWRNETPICYKVVENWWAINVCDNSYYVIIGKLIVDPGKVKAIDGHGKVKEDWAGMVADLGWTHRRDLKWKHIQRKSFQDSKI